MTLDTKTIEALETAVRDLTEAKGPGKSICPSEAARKVATDRGTPENWRWMMKMLRKIAQDLSRSGEIVILRKGRPIPPEEMRGVVRLALAPKPGMDAKTEGAAAAPPPWRGMHGSAGLKK